MMTTRASSVERSAAWPPPGPVTAVVTALPEELAPLVARTAVVRKLRAGSLRVYCGRLGRVPVVLARTGDGAKRAESGVEKLLADFPVGRLLVVGIAGGLSPSLGAGALVVAREVRDGQASAPSPDPAWVQRALRLEGTSGATVVSADRILSTPAAKREAWRALPHGGPAVVDLESATLARAAAARGVPYLVVRAVSDPVEEALPFDPNRCVDRYGGLRRHRVLAQALLRPSSLGPLWRLRRRGRRCAGRLAELVDELLNLGYS